MSGVIAKSLIVTASVIVAAGIAILSDENVRNWLDARRREIAHSFYNMGDGINPDDTEMRQRANSELSADAARRRQDIIQRNRMDILRKAQEEGVSVDLDELAAAGLAEEKAELERSRADKSKSFDHLVGSDGNLRDRDITLEQATASGSAPLPAPATGLKHRGGHGFAAGAMAANPFDDEAQLLFDQELIGTSVGELPKPESTVDSSTVRSVSPRPATEEQIRQSRGSLIDIPVWEANAPTPQPEFKTDSELEAEIEEAIRRSLTDDQLLISVHDTATSEQTGLDTLGSSTALEDSLYAPASPRMASLDEHHDLDARAMAESSTIPTSAYQSMASSYHSTSADNDTFGFQKLEIDEDEDDADGEHTPAGALTPTEDGFSTISSVVGRSAPDIANLADFMPPHRVDATDARSEAATNDSFSVVGASTPGTWTDVDSESETEASNGQSHVVRRTS